MRNGNLTHLNQTLNYQMTFYPTYEEWKQFLIHFAIVSCETFYPTYEEWKPEVIVNTLREHRLFILPMRNGNTGHNVCTIGKYTTFYPTYEEWKLY